MNWFRKKKPVEEIDYHLTDTPIELRLVLKEQDFCVELRWKPIPYNDSDATIIMAKAIVQLITSSCTDHYIKVAQVAASNYGTVYNQNHIAELVIIGLNEFLKRKHSKEPIVSPLKAFIRES